MAAELGRVIATVLAAAGEGLELMRDRGAALRMSDCSIEVVVDDSAEPSAHLRIGFEPERARSDLDQAG